MLKNYLALNASAGSGKTFALAVRYISLLYAGANPSAVVALTFTNKVANEMRERINSILEDIQNFPAELDAIANTLEVNVDNIIKRTPQVKERYIQASLQITTIDSFINKILKAFAINLGILPNYEIGDLSSEDMLESFIDKILKSRKAQALLNIISEEGKRPEEIQEYFHNLNAKDKEALPLLKRYVEDIEPISLSSIEYAKNNVEQIANNLSTLIVSNNRASATAKNQMRFSNIKELLKKSWLFKDTLNYRTFSKCFDPQMDEFLYELKNALREYNSLKEMRSLQELAKLYIMYKEVLFEKKRKAEKLSFSDITNYVYDLIYADDMSPELLLFRLDNKVDHLLVDEFQDTSVVQYKIMKPLIDEITSGATDGNGMPKTFFYVGDVKQSIYRFRGANQNLFLHVAAQHNIEIENLDTNYRSDALVVRFVNEVFQRKYDNYVDQKARAGAEGGLIDVSQSEDVVDEVGNKVKGLLSNGVPARSIAVLVYTNSEVGMVKYEIEKTTGAKCITDSSILLINQPKVKALIAAIKYMYKEENYFLTQFNVLTCNTPDADTVFTDNDELKEDIFLLGMKIAKDFQLFTGDVNFANFLEELRKYKDIEDFYYNIDKLTTSIVNADAIEGVRILTIHKSKGLQFNNVIVMDRTKKKSAERSKFIFETDSEENGIELCAIRYRAKAKEAFDETYRLALQKENAEKYKDALNTLYVALTRAKKRMFIVQDSDFEKSAFSMLDLEVGTTGIYGEIETFEETEREEQTLSVAEENYGKQRFIDNRRGYGNIFEDAFKCALEILSDSTTSSVSAALQSIYSKYGEYLGEKGMAKIKTMLLKTANEQFFQEIKDYKRAQPIQVGSNKVEYIDFIQISDKEIKGYMVGYSDDEVVRARRLLAALKKIHRGKMVQISIYNVEE